MNYSDYIDLGFNRIDLEDEVHFNKTGNKLFAMQYKVNKHLLIDVIIGENPILYYKDQKVCELTVEQMKEVINRTFDLV
jgi:hypothetical protein